MIVMIMIVERDRDRNDHGNQHDHKDPQERKLLWLANEDLDGEQRKAGCQRERRCLLCSGISWTYQPDLFEDLSLKNHVDIGIFRTIGESIPFLICSTRFK